jgi:uncharacterized membrane protein
MKFSVRKPTFLALIHLPIGLSILAAVVSIIGPPPNLECSLSRETFIFSYIPSIASVLLALIGLAFFIYRKQRHYMLIQIGVLVLTLVVGLVINLVLTFCP